MNNLLKTHDIALENQANEIVRRTMIRLFWNNIDLISGETDVDNIATLQWLANHIRHDCNRIVVLTAQSEFTHLIVAKSADISHLHMGNILSCIATDYGGQSNGSAAFAQATFYKQHIAPELIDSTIESIIVALPYDRA